ncbi:hypothetical protein C0431_03625 [bacterium]|nr:hypothetical protein [bacterium]
MIDTHCHLNDQEAFPNPDQAIREAVDAGVRNLIVVGIDEEWSRIAVELADEHPEVYAVVGWHPTSAAKYDPHKLKAIEELAAHPKAVAIGEIGYDFYWDYSTPKQQYDCLIDHLDLANALNMPVVFHCREAYSALLDVLESRPIQPYLFHCFAGTEDDLNRAMELHSIFGVDGPVTYNKADELRRLLPKIGLNRLVLETDAPWLSPVPFRGKPNHPKYLGYIRDRVAEVFEVAPNTVAQATTQVAQDFFRI